MTGFRRGDPVERDFEPRVALSDQAHPPAVRRQRRVRQTEKKFRSMLIRLTLSRIDRRRRAGCPMRSKSNAVGVAKQRRRFLRSLFDLGSMHH